MTQVFSEELQKMYRDILLQQHNIAYTSMIAAFAAAAENAELLTQSTSSALSLLDADIPREDIECDVEIVMVRQFRENLKRLETSMNGMRGKKFGFREVVEMVSTRSPYVSSPGNSFLKRTRTQSLGPLALMPFPSTPTTSKVDGNLAKKPRIADDTATTLDSSCASSYDGNLTIDLPSPAVPEKKPDDNKTAKDASDDPSAEDYKPSKLRIERLRNIHKKKPKFNIENLDLTYHSNMARHFPGSENRTEDQKARRDKNTLAARISRTKNRAYEDMLEKQSIEATSNNINLKRQIACLRIYANELMKANGFPDSNLNQMWEANIRDILCVDV